jgi:hypothetical protein
MSDAEKRMIHGAMRSANEFGAMVRHYTNLVEAAKKGASTSQEVTDGLERDLDAARRDFAVARTVLGQVLGSAGIDVFGPVEGDEEFFEIKASKVEAELEKWRAEQQGVSA